LVYLVVVVVELSKNRMKQDVSNLQVSKKQQNRPCNNLQAIPSRAWTSRNWARCSREIALQGWLVWDRLEYSGDQSIVPLRLPPPNDLHLSRVGNPCRATGLVLLLAEDSPHDTPKSLILWPSPLPLPSACHRPFPVYVRLINAPPPLRFTCPKTLQTTVVFVPSFAV
jgi:hypothetical protein